MSYALHSALLLAVCYLYYRYVLRIETFFQINRWLLLGGMVASFLLPLVTVPAGLSLRATLRTVEPAPVAHAPTREMAIPAPYTRVKARNPALMESPAPARLRPDTPIDVETWLWRTYLAGVAVFGLQFLLQLLAIARTIRRAQTYRMGDLRIVELAGDAAPYSFWDRVFINPDGYDTTTRDRILDHERVHVRQRHSIDLLLSEILIVVQWCNPFAWLYRRAVENNLEYLTDAAVLRRGTDPVGYQLSLLRVALPRHARGLVTNYNQHFLEQRIKMMKTKRSSHRAAWKYLALPALLLFSLSSFNAVAQQSNPDTTGQPYGNRAPLPPPPPPAPPAPPVPAIPPPPPPPRTGSIDMPEGKVRRSWTAEIDGDEVCFQFIESGENGNWNSNSDRCFPLSELGELPRNGIGTFTIEREAGTLQLRGLFDGDEGTGTFDYEPSPAFEQKLKGSGFGSYNTREGLLFFYADITGDYLDYLKRENFSPDREQLLQLAIFDINREFIHQLAAAGYDDLDLSDVVQAKIHDLSPDFIREMGDLGYASVDFDEIVQLAIHGIDADFVAEMSGLGFEDLSVEEVISAKIHGVTPEFIEANRRDGDSFEDMIDYSIMRRSRR